MLASKEEITQFLRNVFPQAPIEVEAAAPMSATVRFKVTEKSLRPGGSVSGPVLMTLADTALYVAILATIGIVPMAVTTNLNINFLRMPKAEKDVVGECKMIKVGKTLAIGEVFIYSDGEEAPVAHATGTYSIPPNRDLKTANR
ncbi:PaaI family thioesterase [Limnobacter sp.]|uniref:PaaI family thioesterase n=1 Tax=Limnobacter sp. TaxID=2003368 RepID=UPI00338E4CE6